MNNLFLFLFLLSIVGLVVGLIKPSYTKLKSRREVSFLFGGAIIVFFILVGVTGQSTPTSTPPANVPAPQVISNTTSPSTPTTTPVAQIPPAPTNNTPTPSKTTSAGNKNSATVNQTAPAPVAQPTPPPALVVSCSPAQSTLTTGQTGVWTAQASGGVQNYSYSWSGTSGLSGSSRSVSINYGTAGTESASVVVTSGSQSVNQTCNGTITVSNPAPTQTVSQQNAVKAAQQYLNYTAFSQGGLVAQLEHDQFSQADATYGADNSGADWNEEAIQAAQNYLNYTAFSQGGLVAQLEHDQFTQAQATYGVNNVNANWDQEAAKAAQQYMAYSAFSRGSLIAQLEHDQFTQEQAEYGADSVGLTQ